MMRYSQTRLETRIIQAMRWIFPFARTDDLSSLWRVSPINHPQPLRTSRAFTFSRDQTVPDHGFDGAPPWPNLRDFLPFTSRSLGPSRPIWKERHNPPSKLPSSSSHISLDPIRKHSISDNRAGPAFTTPPMTPGEFVLSFPDAWPPGGCQGGGSENHVLTHRTGTPWSCLSVGRDMPWAR